MFSSLRSRDFRIYWIGMFVSLCGTWIQSMAQSWLVFELSNSSFLLGLVGFFSYLPIFLFSLFSGVLVDRINKKYLLLFTQIAFMGLAFLLAIFTQFEIVTVKFILIIAMLNGIVLSLDAPARQSIVVEFVGKQKLFNAIALNSIAFHSARMLGPALAGILIATIGISGCFYINAISFLAFIIALLLINPKHATKNKNNKHFLVDLKSGIKFIMHNRAYFNLIGIVGIISMFGFSYVVLMPVFAKVIFNLDVRGFGLLMSASGVGSLLAGLRLANLKESSKHPRVLVFSLFAFSLSLIIFALSKSIIFSSIILVFIGFNSLSALVIINSMIQIMVPNEFRGRVMSIYILVFAGSIPFGSVIAGSLSQALGPSGALVISGVVCLGLFLLFTKKVLKNGLALA